MSRRLGLVLSPLAAAAFYFFLPNLGPEGRATAATAVLMAGWWLSEALPLPATALVPVALFPLAGAGSISQSTAPYAHKLIFLFMGGFMIAGAMERWNLHRRIALWTVSKVGARPSAIVAAFMGVTAFLSMWVSNTATAMMMLSIGASIVAVVPNKNFSTALVLGIAYSASIGGMATLIGTPPNALLAAFLEQQYGFQIGFAHWMLVGVPLAAVFLPLTWWLLVKRLYPVPERPAAGGERVLAEKYAALGRMKPAERRIAAVFAVVAAAWILRPLLKDLWPGGFGRLDDAGIAIIGALILFLLPSGGKTGERVLDWDTAQKIPWGVLLIFGGGLSLASAMTRNGVAEYLGGMFSGFAGAGPLVLILAVTTMIVFLTELTSNTATTAAFLPVLAAAAVGIGVHPYLLLFPAALSASCAFMMPVATPPNAIVFASGHVSIRQMARAGLWLNLAAILLITGLISVLAGPVLGVN